MPKINKVKVKNLIFLQSHVFLKERLLFLSPTVQAGWEDESTISDFDKIKSLGTGFAYFL